MRHPKLLSIDTGLGLGIAPDLHDTQPFLWHDARNVYFNSKGVRKMRGWSAALATTGSTPVRGIQQQLAAPANLGYTPATAPLSTFALGESEEGAEVPVSSTGPGVFYGNQTDIYRWNQVTEVAVGTGYTGLVDAVGASPASVWSLVDFGAWMLATNNKDAPQLYKGGSFFAIGGGIPATVKIFQKIGPHILGFGTANDPRELIWCTEDDPEEWTPTAANSAGSLLMRELNSGVIAAVRLGSSVAVYGTNSMGLAYYRGSPFYFGFNAALTGIGAIGQQVVIDIGRLHFGISQDGFWQTDGTSYRYIATETVRDTVFAELNTVEANKICGYHNEKEGQVVWYYPTAGSSEPDKGVAYSYISGGWAFLDHGRTSASTKTIFAYPFTALANGDLLFENFGTTADGAAIVAYAESKKFAFQDREGSALDDFMKYINLVKLGFESIAGAGVRVELGVSNYFDGPFVFQSLQLGTDKRQELYPELSGVWFILRVYSDQVADSWDFRSLQIHGRLIGRAP